MKLSSKNFRIEEGIIEDDLGRIVAMPKASRKELLKHQDLFTIEGGLLRISSVLIGGFEWTGSCSFKDELAYCTLRPKLPLFDPQATEVEEKLGEELALAIKELTDSMDFSWGEIVVGYSSRIRCASIAFSYR